MSESTKPAKLLDRAPEMLREAKALIDKGLSVDKAAKSAGFKDGQQYYYYARRFGVESPALDSEKRDAEIDEINRQTRENDAVPPNPELNDSAQLATEIYKKISDLQAYMVNELAGSIKALCAGIETAATVVSTDGKDRPHIIIYIQEVNIHEDQSVGN